VLLAVLTGVVTLAGASAGHEVASMSPREKAAILVVSGLPAPAGVGGVFVRPWDRTAPRPRGALVFVDQEGGTVKAFRELPPDRAASAFTTGAEARRTGRATGRALRRAGVHVDLAPVLDTPGPLGSRHFRRPALGIAFARGLGEGGVAACVKHFPGLGSAPRSTDDAPRVPARLQAAELAGFRAAVRAGVPCVMTSHAFYRRFGDRRALVAPGTYRMLRQMGFRGVTITDSLSIVRGPWPRIWARDAARAGADLLLFTSPEDAEGAIRMLLPLARRGELDASVARVLRFRRSLGMRAPPAVRASWAPGVQG
jgi:beta-N-acetylhexosaminidase